MGDESQGKGLAQLREQLDAIDAELITLLHRRAALALEVRAAKKRDELQVYSPEREREILERVADRAAEGAFPARQMQQIFLDILSATRSLVGDLQVAFVGPKCSIADFAARAKFGEHVQYNAAHTTAEVFSRVERGEASCGVIPIYSSSTGLADRSLNLLIESEVQVIAEVEVSEQLGLFSKAETLANVKTIYGLPSVFEQTQSWLAAHCGHALRTLSDSLDNVVARVDADPTAALITLHALTEQTEIPLLASGLEESLRGYARCLVLGTKAPSPTGRDKTTVVCAVTERAGALRDILQPFAAQGVTLLRIESRPTRNRAGEFVFFIDLAGHQQDPACATAISQLNDLCSWVRIAGSYPLVCS